MTLPSSGPISMSQVSTELSRASNAATSLGESAVRSLAGVASGSIGFNNLLGKSAYLDQVTLTAGYALNTDGYSYWEDLYGYQSGWYGSLNKYTFVPKGLTISAIYTTSYGYTYFNLNAATTNAGWTSMKIGSETWNRASAGFSSGTGYTIWYWTTQSTAIVNAYSSSTPIVVGWL